MTPKQHERQKHRNSGRYANVNPCRSCGKSAGVDYCSHPDTDGLIADELICLCIRCYRVLSELSGPEAIEKVRSNGRA